MDNLAERQETEAREDRVDYDQVDTEIIQDVRKRRKQDRAQVDEKVARVAVDNRQDDDDFRMDLDKVNKKFRVKRKKKYLFNEEGVKIEPFKMDSSTVENHGGVLLMHEARRGSDDEDDPWYESIRTQQEELLKEEAKKQKDSDEEYESSEDEDKISKNPEDTFTVPKEKKRDKNEIIDLKKKL